MARRIYEVEMVEERYRVLEISLPAGPDNPPQVVGVFDSYAQAQVFVERTLLKVSGIKSG